MRVLKSVGRYIGWIDCREKVLRAQGERTYRAGVDRCTVCLVGPIALRCLRKVCRAEEGHHMTRPLLFARGDQQGAG